MSIFGKLFGSHFNNSQSTKAKINEFFEIDLKNIPDETFIKTKEDVNTSGQVVKTYQKQLSYQECGIFDFVEVKVIADDAINVFFINYNQNQIDIGKMKTLINRMYELYGIDEYKRGRFENKENKEFKDPDFDYLWGRSWGEYPKYKYPIRIGKDEEKVELAIWGINT